MPTSSHTRLTVGTAAIALLVGCAGGDPNRFKVYPVEGGVTVGGKPAAGAKVFFHPTDRIADPATLRPFATADEAGKFRLTTYLLGDGASAGPYVVTVTWPPPPRGDDEPAGDRLKGAYADAKTSPLRVTVRAEPTTLEPFALK